MHCAVDGKISSLVYQQMDPLTWLVNIKVLFPTFVTIHLIWYMVFGVVLINWIWLFNLQQDNFCMVHLCNLLQKQLETTPNLQRQKYLILKMKTKCLQFIDTRWMSMDKVLHRFNANQIQLQQFLDEHQHSWKPPLHWWVSAIVLEQILMRSNEGFTRLQGLTTLLS